MTDYERLNILWNAHNAHIDEHRYVSRRMDKLENRIKHLEKVLQNMLPPIEINVPEIPE